MIQIFIVEGSISFKLLREIPGIFKESQLNKYCLLLVSEERIEMLF
jgi:hypothetical protein